MNDATGLETIWTHLDDDRLSALLVESVDQYSPTYAEEAAMGVFAGALARHGIAFQRQPVLERQDSASRGNLVITLGPEPLELLWVGHVDTVPYSEDGQDSWLEDDVLHGLGTADMKAGCAAAIEALIATVESGVELRRGLCVALVVGEEEYGDGAQTLAETVWAPLTVIGEPTALKPNLDHYGYYECRLTARGTQAHAALPEFGSSAIHDMLAWLMKILEVSGSPSTPGGFVVNPREITGGAGAFVVADSCEALLDVHVPPQTERRPIEAMLDEARQFVLAGQPDAELSAEELFWAPGFSVDPEQALLISLRDAFHSCELPWQLAAFRSHSDAPVFQSRGSVPLLCGPGRLEVAHTRHEHVEMTQVRDAARLYAAMIHSACIAPR